MISEATAVGFRQNLGDMLNQMQVRHDSIVIKRDGKPVAASGLGHLQAQVIRVGLEVPVAEEQRQAGLDAGGGDDPVNRFAHRDPLAAQRNSCRAVATSWSVLNPCITSTKMRSPIASGVTPSNPSSRSTSGVLMP